MKKFLNHLFTLLLSFLIGVGAACGGDEEDSNGSTDVFTPFCDALSNDNLDPNYSFTFTEKNDGQVTKERIPLDTASCRQEDSANERESNFKVSGNFTIPQGVRSWQLTARIPNISDNLYFEELISPNGVNFVNRIKEAREARVGAIRLNHQRSTN